jgi:DNA ligase-1
MDLLEGILLHL